MVTSEISDGRPTSISIDKAIKIAKSLIKMHRKHFREKNYFPLRVTPDQISELGRSISVDDTTLFYISEELMEFGYRIMGVNGRMYVVTDAEYGHYNELMSEMHESINHITRIMTL